MILQTRGCSSLNQYEATLNFLFLVRFLSLCSSRSLDKTHHFGFEPQLARRTHSLCVVLSPDKSRYVSRYHAVLLDLTLTKEIFSISVTRQKICLLKATKLLFPCTMILDDWQTWNTFRLQILSWRDRCLRPWRSWPSCVIFLLPKRNYLVICSKSPCIGKILVRCVRILCCCLRKGNVSVK